MNNFIAHGTLDVQVEGRLLILEGTGPWNLESLYDSGKVAAPLVKPLHGKPWGAIVTIYGEPIYVPEAAEVLTEVVRQDKVKGRVATALIVDNCSSPRFAKTHIGQIYKNAGETYQCFSDFADAKSWVSQQIAKAELDYLLCATELMRSSDAMSKSRISES